jgi:hypothetical protein
VKALIYSDLQATDGHEKSFLEHDTPLQIKRVRKFYGDLHAIFAQHECDCLWDLGDTTDDRSALPMTAIDAVMEGLSRFPDHKWNLKLIGNHEQYLRDATVHVGRMFDPYFRVIPDTDVLDVNAEVAIACAAYPATDQKLSDWLAATMQKLRGRDSVLLGHFQVVGAEMSGGSAVTGIQLKAIKRFGVTFLGHVHRPQALSETAFYVGSPFQQNFGEAGENKRVAVFDLDTFKITWVPLVGYPEYRTVPFKEWAAQVKEGSEDRYQVRLANAEEAEAFYAHPLMSRANPAYSYEMPEEAAKQAEQQKAWTREDVMRRYVDQTPPTSRGIDIPTEELVEIGAELAETE